MLKFLATLLLSIAAVGAGAVPIVAGGSSYAIYLSGSNSSNTITMTNAFDGVAEGFSRTGHDVSVNDSETALGGGQHRIILRGTATGDMFPVLGETAYIGMGVAGDGLDMLMSVYLVDARIRYYSSAGLVFSTNNLADDYRDLFFSGAWNGLFPRQGSVFFNGNMGGRNVNAFELDFLVSELANPVPEPSALALALAGLLAMALMARKRGRKEAGAAI